MNKSYVEKTSADNKAIGFDFQYYYFLLRLLQIREGQTVGLEVKDDVHTDLDNDRQILIQLKHTVQKQASGKSRNLTELDVDFWKTISNWKCVISDENSGRKDVSSQMKFVDRTVFLFASNKSDNENNNALKKIRDLKNSDICFSEFDVYIKQLLSRTVNVDVVSYINNILSLDAQVRENFIKNIDFELDIESIIMLCKAAIKEKMIDESSIESVFHSLDSQLRQDNFLDISNGKKIVISFREFYRKYKICFDLARNHDLVIKKYDSEVPAAIEEQIFIKQLIDINDLDLVEFDFMVELTREKLLAITNIERWLAEGEVTSSQIEYLEKEIKVQWRNEFRSKNKPRPNDEDIDVVARNILKTMRDRKFDMNTKSLSTEFSNGKIYQMSDIPVLGWHVDWLAKYK